LLPIESVKLAYTPVIFWLFRGAKLPIESTKYFVVGYFATVSSPSSRASLGLFSSVRQQPKKTTTHL